MPRDRSKLALLVLLVAFLAASAIQITAIVLKEHRRMLEYDEAVAYLAASAHEGAYTEAKSGGLNDRWVPAKDWKDLMRPGPVFGLVTIARDLGHTDYHPPLYFWILHFWVLAFGMHVSAGLWLNLVIALLTGVILFFFARELLGDPLEAALVAAVWILATPVVVANVMARHYPLFGLLTALFTWLVWRACDRPVRRRDYVAFGAVTAAGALTHYHFALVIVGGAVYAAVRLWRKDRRRLFTMTGAAVAGVAVAIAVNPWFTTAYQRQSEGQTQAFTMGALRERFSEIGPRLAVFFGWAANDAPGWFKPLVGPFRRATKGVLPASTAALGLLAAVVLLVLVAAAVLLIVRRTRAPIVGYVRAIDWKGFSVLFFLVWIAGFTIALFLAMKSPPWGLGARYLSAVWPFMAFVPVFLARLLKRWRYLAVVVLLVVFVVPQSIDHMLGSERIAASDTAALEKAQRVLIDTVTRGVTTRIVWFVPDGTPVYVGRMNELTAQPDAWLAQLAPGDVWVSWGSDPASVRMRKQIEALLEQRFTLEPVAGQVPGVVGTLIFRLGAGAEGARPPERAARNGRPVAIAHAGRHALECAGGRPRSRRAPGTPREKRRGLRRW